MQNLTLEEGKNIESLSPKIFFLIFSKSLSVDLPDDLLLYTL